MLMDSTFPPDETVKEHKVVYKEIERYLDNPDDVLGETFSEMLYQVHPYRIPVLGYPDRFRGVTRDEVWAYYQERYSPDICCFIATGDIDAKVVMPQMARTLATWVRKSVPPAPIDEEARAGRQARASPSRTRSAKSRNSSSAIPAFRSAIRRSLRARPARQHSRRRPLQAGSIAQEVKDKQDLVTDIAASDYTPMYHGLFLYSQWPRPRSRQGRSAARDAILKVLEDRCKNSSADSAEELARAPGRK